ncbi:MAG TPA: 30S ribosomal protein S11 [Candidatus Saccharibacteria bacterium]|jgi:small subunit ribosomal protein S11|nr:30S ribosomal protein S11 [Candidatus Saccharibacteria bacterium]
MAATTSTKKKKKAKRSVSTGRMCIKATFNNTIVTITDITGNVLAASSSGACGFRGSKKGTAYAAQVAAEKALNLAKTGYGLNAVDVFVNGVGQGRDTAIRSAATSDIQVSSINDTTAIPFGGCRPKKAKKG